MVHSQRASQQAGFVYEPNSFVPRESEGVMM